MRKVKQFHRHCGMLPAPDYASNPLGYKFSWSPRGGLAYSCPPRLVVSPLSMILGFLPSPTPGFSPELSSSTSHSGSWDGFIHDKNSGRSSYQRPPNSSSLFQGSPHLPRPLMLRDISADELLAHNNTAFRNLTLERNAYATRLKESQLNYHQLLETINSLPPSSVAPTSLFPYDPSHLEL
ncbi:hypothetical protein B0H14DRAFT_3483847 [Mycena olivaceomarginata]|nr:hypothetical protein B0H14DRAFT_3483847 [Mycena olivaceomarginata]